MAWALRAEDRGRGDATLAARRPGTLVLALVAVGVALIVFGSDSLPAVIAGILAILAAGFVAMRTSG